jgi:hypothetical protein
MRTIKIIILLALSFNLNAKNIYENDDMRPSKKPINKSLLYKQENEFGIAFLKINFKNNLKMGYEFNYFDTANKIILKYKGYANHDPNVNGISEITFEDYVKNFGTSCEIRISIGKNTLENIKEFEYAAFSQNCEKNYCSLFKNKEENKYCEKNTIGDSMNIVKTSHGN